jgi:hypothetical protein
MPDKPKYSFMVPVVKIGSAYQVALADAMRAAKYGSLDDFAREPYVELRPSTNPVGRRPGMVMLRWVHVIRPEARAAGRRAGDPPNTMTGSALTRFGDWPYCPKYVRALGRLPGSGGGPELP